VYIKAKFLVLPLGQLHEKQITDQSSNIKTLCSLLGPSRKSKNLQVLVATQRLVDNITIAKHMRNSTVSTVASGSVQSLSASRQITDGYTQFLPTCIQFFIHKSSPNQCCAAWMLYTEPENNPAHF
jgi:hypothetical protein